MANPLHDFVLDRVFAAATRNPARFRRRCVPVARLGWYVSRHLRRVCRSNGRLILGDDASTDQLKRYGQDVIRDFLRFVGDISIASDQSTSSILERIAESEGEAHFQTARDMGRGVILATCHMGNFEVGAAAVSSRVAETHVLFQGDAHGAFDTMRARLHERLGLTNAAIEQGLDAWIQLRDALGRGGAVLIQADRCMPGQKGQATAFLNGHVVMPNGPSKLARLSGAPIVPITCVARNDGRTRIIIAPPIRPDACKPSEFEAYTRKKLAGFFSGVIREYPSQWHILYPAFIENAEPPKTPKAFHKLAL